MRILTAVAALALASSGFAQTFFDDFNRADSGDLGANYDHIAGTATRVISNQAGNITGSNNLSLVKSSVFTGTYSQTTVEADVMLTDQTSALAYVALALGHDASTTTGHGMFIKVQRQAVGGFSHIGFYTAVGTNNTTAITGGGGNFVALTTRFDRAHMKIWTSDPTTINLGFDTDFDGNYDQIHTRTLVFPNLVVGNRVGLGVYGATGRADNFKANVVPEPASIAALSLGALALLRRRRRKAA